MWLTLHRVCDPEVGVGLKQGACRGACNRWFAACRREFFEFDPITDDLMPCSDGYQKSPVCARLADLAIGGEDLCSKVGVAVVDSPPCFDGTSPVTKLPSCQPSVQRPRTPPLQTFSWRQLMHWVVDTPFKRMLVVFAAMGLLYTWKVRKKHTQPFVLSRDPRFPGRGHRLQ